jgi:hypothetical protein
MVPADVGERTSVKPDQLRATLLAAGEDVALNLRQVQAWTGMSKNKLHGEIRAGRLRQRRQGSRLFYSPSDVREWLRGEPTA